MGLLSNSSSIRVILQSLDTILRLLPKNRLTLAFLKIESNCSKLFNPNADMSHTQKKICTAEIRCAFRLSFNRWANMCRQNSCLQYSKKSFICILSIGLTSCYQGRREEREKNYSTITITGGFYFCNVFSSFSFL